MRSEHRLTRPQQYASVYDKGSSFSSDLLVIRVLPNGLPISRYGFSINKRVGNAVIRNRIKRRLREIMRVTALVPSRDIVFIIRPSAAGTDYTGIKKEVERLLSRAGLINEVEKTGK
jgi:ribonuclease P protein component